MKRYFFGELFGVVHRLLIIEHKLRGVARKPLFLFVVGVGDNASCNYPLTPVLVRAPLPEPSVALTSSVHHRCIGICTELSAAISQQCVMCFSLVPAK